MAQVHPAKEIARQKRIEDAARLVIAGQTLKDAAKLLNCHYNTIRNDAKTPLFLETLERLREKSGQKAEEQLTDTTADVIETLRRGTEKAVRVMVSKLDSTNENIQVKAAADLMDRDARTSKRRRVTHEPMPAFITPEWLALAAETARMISTPRLQIAGDAANVPVVEVSAVSVEDESHA